MMVRYVVLIAVKRLTLNESSNHKESVCKVTFIFKVLLFFSFFLIAAFAVSNFKMYFSSFNKLHVLT